MENSTHGGSRHALRALTVGGAFVAVTMAAALPAAAADNVTSTTTTTAVSDATTATDTATDVVSTTPASTTATAAVATTDAAAADNAAAAASVAAPPAAPKTEDAGGNAPGTDNGKGNDGQNNGGGNAPGTDNGKGNDGQNNGGTGGQGGPGNGGGGDQGRGNGGDHNPPGNNGTVKIHDVPGDTQPYDVAHLTCNGYVDFFGFDAGQTVTVTFTGQAPTGKDIVLPFTWTGVVSTDDAGGAGNDFDFELPINANDLGVSALGEPHPIQGYHIKMDVATGEPGGHKYKVFWIAPCEEQPPPPPPPGGHHHHHHGGGVSGEHHHRGGHDHGGTVHQGGTKQHSKVQAVHEHRATPVLAVHTTRTPAVQQLPFTGANGIGGELLAGLSALTGGVALSVAGRRRRTVKR